MKEGFRLVQVAKAALFNLYQRPMVLLVLALCSFIQHGSYDGSKLVRYYDGTEESQ